jgi:hypothetical protein
VRVTPNNHGPPRRGPGSLTPSFPLFDFRGVLELLVGDIHAVSAELLVVVQHLLMGASGDSPDLQWASAPSVTMCTQRRRELNPFCTYVKFGAGMRQEIS